MKNGERLLTDEQAHEICKLLEEGEKCVDIANMYNVKRNVISSIKRRISYRNISNIYTFKSNSISSHKSNYSDEFIKFIMLSLTENKTVSDILSSEMCEEKDKSTLFNLVSNIKHGRTYKRLAKSIGFDKFWETEQKIFRIDKNIILDIATELNSNMNISNKELSEKYDVGINTVSDIKCGQIHKDITGFPTLEPIKHIDPAIVISIANDLRAVPKMSMVKISKKYNVNYATINRIKNGNSHSSITGILPKEKIKVEE